MKRNKYIFTGHMPPPPEPKEKPVKRKRKTDGQKESKLKENKSARSGLSTKPEAKNGKTFRNLFDDKFFKTSSSITYLNSRKVESLTFGFLSCNIVLDPKTSVGIKKKREDDVFTPICLPFPSFELDNNHKPILSRDGHLLPHELNETKYQVTQEEQRMDSFIKQEPIQAAASVNGFKSGPTLFKPNGHQKVSEAKYKIPVANVVKSFPPPEKPKPVEIIQLDSSDDNIDAIMDEDDMFLAALPDESLNIDVIQSSTSQIKTQGVKNSVNGLSGSAKPMSASGLIWSTSLNHSGFRKD